MSGFNVNDEVIHCREGLATIIGSKEMNGKSYFLVHANRASGETCYVPVDSANSIIREIMDYVSLRQLIKILIQTQSKEEMLIKRDFPLVM